MVLIWHESNRQEYKRSGFSLLCWTTWQSQYHLWLLFRLEIHLCQCGKRPTVDTTTLTAHLQHVICHWCYSTVPRLQRRGNMSITTWSCAQAPQSIPHNAGKLWEDQFTDYISLLYLCISLSLWWCMWTNKLFTLVSFEQCVSHVIA